MREPFSCADARTVRLDAPFYAPLAINALSALAKGRCVKTHPTRTTVRQDAPYKDNGASRRTLQGQRCVKMHPTRTTVRQDASRFGLASRCEVHECERKTYRSPKA